MRFAVHFLALVVLACAHPSVCFPASLLLDASLRQLLEDNVNPLLSGAGLPRSGAETAKSVPTGGRLSGGGLMQSGSAGTGTGDLHTVLSARAGVHSLVGPEAELSIKAGFERREFWKFSELNATSAGLFGTLFKQLSDIHAMQIGLAAVHSACDFQALAGNSARGSLELRQKLSMKFWLNEGFEYERYDARSDAFDYNGRSASLRAGYRITASITPMAAYTCLLRKFGNGMQTTVHSVAFGAAWRIIPGLDLTASFERLTYSSIPLNTRGRNNISSLGLAVYY